MPAWGGAERLSALVGKGKALLLAGTGTILDAAEAQRFGLVDVVVPRASFDEEWRALAKKLAAPPVASIKGVVAGASAEDAVGAFARLWVSDEHWAAADRVLNRARPGQAPRPAS